MQREHRTTDFQHEEFQTMNTDPISYAQVKMKSIMNASDFVKLQDEDKDRPLFRKCLLDNLNDLRRLIIALASRKGSRHESSK
ncbi:MAG: hypothetical protein AABZ06_00925 [Bdellovibrionota bacterium]